VQVAGRIERSLQVKVVEAKELKGGKHALSTYAKISIDNEKKARTPSLYKELKPAWDQECIFLIICIIT
jgi:hypothetical protein